MLKQQIKSHKFDKAVQSFDWPMSYKLKKPLNLLIIIHSLIMLYLMTLQKSLRALQIINQKKGDF